MTTTTDIFTGGKREQLLPAEVTTEIWGQTFEESVVAKLSGTKAITINGQTAPVVTKRPSAQIIGESQPKSASDFELGAKTMKVLKAHVGFALSWETVLANPAGALEIIRDEFSSAIARQIDLAVIHGRNAADGTQLTSVDEFLSQTTNAVEVADDAGIDAAIFDGASLISRGARYNGLAVDDKFSTRIAAARDSQGRRLYPDVSLGGELSSFSGVPMAASPAVSGDTDASDVTNILAIGGDWKSLTFGKAAEITFKTIEYGDPFGTGDLQNLNQIGVRSEIIFGYSIRDLDAFVKYTSPSGE